MSQKFHSNFSKVTTMGSLGSSTVRGRSYFLLKIGVLKAKGITENIPNLIHVIYEIKILKTYDSEYGRTQKAGKFNLFFSYYWRSKLDFEIANFVCFFIEDIRGSITLL